MAIYGATEQPKGENIADKMARIFQNIGPEDIPAIVQCLIANGAEDAFIGRVYALGDKYGVRGSFTGGGGIRNPGDRAGGKRPTKPNW